MVREGNNAMNERYLPHCPRCDQTTLRLAPVNYVHDIYCIGDYSLLAIGCTECAWLGALSDVLWKRQ